MTTVLEQLKQGVSNYPIPTAMLQGVAVRRGVDLQAEATEELMRSKGFRLAKADVMLFASLAPNVSQAGINFDFLVNTREQLKSRANAIYKEYGDSLYESETMPRIKYGYKGKKR